MGHVDVYGILGVVFLVFLLAGSAWPRRRPGRPRMIIPDVEDISRQAAADDLRGEDPELRRLQAQNREMAEMLRLAFSASAIERATFDRMRAATLAQARIDRLKKNPRLMESLRALGASLKDLDHPDIMKDHFRRKVKSTHPDAGGSEADLRAVTDAWNYLKPIMS